MVFGFWLHLGMECRKREFRILLVGVRGTQTNHHLWTIPHLIYLFQLFIKYDSILSWFAKFHLNICQHFSKHLELELKQIFEDEKEEQFAYFKQFFSVLIFLAFLDMQIEY
jgi:hypothetical protein